MLLFAGFLRGTRRLVITASATALVALVWSTVLRFAAAPAPGRISEFLVAVGTPLLAPFDSLGRSAALSNGGTFAWTSLLAMLSCALLGATVAWLLARASDRLIAFDLAKQGPTLEELREQAPDIDRRRSSFGPPRNNAPSH